MVPQEKAQTVLDEYVDYAHDELTPYNVACALETFDVAVSVHAEDIDYLEEGYEDLLEAAAALTRGAVTVTSVRLHEGEFVDGSRYDVLEFERNGQLVSIPAEHLSDDYYDPAAACNAIARSAASASNARTTASTTTQWSSPLLSRQGHCRRTLA